MLFRGTSCRNNQRWRWRRAKKTAGIQVCQCMVAKVQPRGVNLSFSLSCLECLPLHHTHPSALPSPITISQSPGREAAPSVPRSHTVEPKGCNRMLLWRQEKCLCRNTADANQDNLQWRKEKQSYNFFPGNERVQRGDTGSGWRVNPARRHSERPGSFPVTFPPAIISLGTQPENPGHEQDC